MGTDVPLTVPEQDQSSNGAAPDPSATPARPLARDLPTPKSPSRTAVSTGIALRLPVVALALGGILWYMPARPEGVAIGVALVPLTLLWVGLRSRTQAGDQPTSPN